MRGVLSLSEANQRASLLVKGLAESEALLQAKSAAECSPFFVVRANYAGTQRAIPILRLTIL